MNIFILDNDIEKSAQYHNDKHVIKMILETAQIMSAVCRISGIDQGYKLTHKNHPCTKWARESFSNYMYLRDFIFCLHDEWHYRYNHPVSKIHKSYQVAIDLPLPEIEDIGLTPFALAMPNEYKCGDPVESYRAYYMGDKRHLASWKKRGAPDWWK